MLCVTIYGSKRLLEHGNTENFSGHSEVSLNIINTSVYNIIFSTINILYTYLYLDLSLIMRHKDRDDAHMGLSLHPKKFVDFPTHDERSRNFLFTKYFLIVK